MRTTSAFQFYCRNSKANKQGYAPVELSIIINGTRRFINLPMRFRPEEFNKKRQPKEIIDAIDLWRTKITNYTVDMMREGIPLTTESLREIIQTGGIKAYTVGRMFDEYYAILQRRVGVDLTAGSYRKYEVLRDKVYEHISPDSQMGALTPAKVKTIVTLWNSQYDLSTTAGYITKFKSVVRFAMDNGHLTINPFQGIKVQKPRKPINALTEEEVQLILNTHIADKRLRKIRDLFLIGCGTGMAYCDIMNFSVHDIKKEGNQYYICKIRQKTKHIFTAMIMPWAVPIIYSRLVIPHISNQKFNKYLKELAEVVGINKRITVHMARRTYASMLVNRGVSMDIVAAALGDNPAIAAQYYAKVYDSTIIQAQAAAFAS